MSVCKLTLALLVLQLGLAKCFSWDIIVSEGKWLQFYNNGTLTHIEGIQSAKEITSIIYDPVHYRVLFADDQGSKKQLSTFDLSTRNIQPLVTRTSISYLRVTYDPVTQLLIWLEDWQRIYSFSLNPACSNKAVDVNFILTTPHTTYDVAVDSCRGYIYWVTEHEIERVRFDGSEREALINSKVHYRLSLTFDHQTQKMYWIERVLSDDHQISIESADFNGKNRSTLYTINNETNASSLTVSNDFIYWNGIDQKEICQLPKNLPQKLVAKLLSTFNNAYWYYQVIAANYTIKDQLKGNQNCETLKSLIPNEFEPDCIDVKLCVHGTKVSGESRCECTQGYTGEKCDISVCQNYCFHGNCSVSAEGQPICSCNAGYSRERCEVEACYKHCLNNAVCSLNEEDEPVCECTADYEGERCDIAITQSGICGNDMTPQILRDLRSEVKQVIKEELQLTLRSEVKQVQVIKEELQSTLRSEVNQVQIIKEELQSTLRSEMNQVQVIKEDLQRTLRFYSDKNEENEAKIQNYENKINDLGNQSLAFENHGEITSKTLTSNTFSETN